MKSLLFFSFFSLSSCASQEIHFPLSKEKIVIKDENWFFFGGQLGDSLFRVDAGLLGNSADFWLYDELTQSTEKISSFSLQNKKIVNAQKISNNMLMMTGYFHVVDSFMQVPFWDLPIYEFEHQDIWIYYCGKTHLIKSFPMAFIDKYISHKISFDRRYLIINPYYADAYRNYKADLPDDNVIYLYDLEKLRQGIVQENAIPCELCYNTYVIDNTLIFGKEFTIGDRGIEFVHSNIYKAPIGNINDTTLIARNMTLLDISPDGRYILGMKTIHRKRLIVILDVQAQRYQYIVGRNYPTLFCFYSYQKQKFAFDFENHLIYIEFPDEFPHDAMIPYKPDWSTREEVEAFWNTHTLPEHKPLE